MSRLTQPGLAAVLLLGVVAIAGTEPQIEDPFRVVEQLDGLAEKQLWPGFDPRKYPVAIYDGNRTWLFRHPQPPEQEFTRSERDTEVWFHQGRHPAMRSNSKASIGGITTGTLLLTFRPGRSAREEASILIHETFHIFQDARYPRWTANEAHRFTYPVADLANYLATILEDNALARALETEDVESTAGWAARAMELRARRRSRLAPEHREFELGLEMMEGTAFYVAHLALNESESTDRLLDVLPPEQFRWRPYATGGAIAALLDRMTPGWKTSVGQSADTTLEQLLRDCLEASETPPAEFSETELRGFGQRAEAAIAELVAERKARRSVFENQQVWRVIVDVAAGVDRFHLDQFDPINMRNLGQGDLLHGHRLTLTHPAGQVRMANPRFVRREFVGLNALSSVAEGHQLLAACREVVFTGFADVPQADSVDGRITVRADGLELELEPATVTRTGKTIRVTVGASTPRT